jgi:hypothetical protein
LYDQWQDLMQMVKKETIAKELITAIGLAGSRWSKAVCKEADELALVSTCQRREAHGLEASRVLLPNHGPFHRLTFASNFCVPLESPMATLVKPPPADL